jgi:hypothetical protein
MSLVFDQKDRVGEWVARKVDQTASWGSFYAMGIERDGEIVAGIVFNNMNGVNATCHIAIEKAGKAFLELLCHAANYAFNHCKLKRLTGMVPASKPDVLAFDLHLGWQEEFVMQDAAFDGGPLHVLVMRPETCRWLKGN